MIHALSTVLAIAPVVSAVVFLADWSPPLLNQAPRLPWKNRFGYEMGVPVSKSYPKATGCADWTGIRPNYGNWRLLPILIPISTFPIRRPKVYLP